MDPLWYKDAVIYEVHVRAFFDSNNDGVGDFPGLTQRLDYLQSLGVNCLWLLPFYPSPLRDDGYDIMDYRSVHPVYGSRRDVRTFVREAHARGIRVITELVINHTSDQHPWFQAARRAPRGSSKRDFYVWSDRPDKYSDVRIIFTDSETSNWTWDPVAKAYYWHRFFHHQPDLNFDNPVVRRTVLKIMRFWLELGIDGLRLDAVPYLIERDGTTCENLAETHEVLKDIRRELDSHYTGRVLLAEANQWPADVLPYFGDDDECQMAFHFPLMPRIFMAVQQEDRHPITDILRQTPEIPSSCQWGLFLRNHDEMTLEMVTDEERDYMYAAYAADPQMRINLGIRRRLAPLMNNSRQRIELLNSLLLSMPGTPILYYGDEIGMGDNIYLGDRNGVRTPMQWTGDRNGGFSKADPAKLYAPPVMDPVYGYQAINVESQERSPSSLLNWMRRLIALRKQYQTFGRGGLTLLYPDNRKVIAYVRHDDEHTILVVANLASTMQPVELELSAFEGLVPVEMLGQAPLPQIRADQPYFLTLGPHAFYWLELQRETSAVAAVGAQRSPARSEEEQPLPVLMAGVAWDTFMDGHLRVMLEKEALPQFLGHQRWFAGKARAISGARFTEWATLVHGTEPAFLTIVEVTYQDGGCERYFLPLMLANASTIAAEISAPAQRALARLSGARQGLILDALVDERACTALLSALESIKPLRTRRGAFATTSAARGPLVSPDAELRPTLCSGEQSNSSVTFGHRYIMKLFRRLEPGINPDVEIGQFLSTHQTGARVPRLVGSLDYLGDDGEGIALGVLQEFVPSLRNGWQQAIHELTRYFERAQALERAGETVEHDAGPMLYWIDDPIPEVVEDAIGAYLTSVTTLAQRTAELHLGLSRNLDDPDFAPEPLTTEDRRGLADELERHADSVFRVLEERLPSLSAIAAGQAREVLDRRAILLRKLASVRSLEVLGTKIRIHGDYHLGQVLDTGGDFVIIDFEGEPDRPLAYRRAKQSPLRDVAGMLRSLSYAAHAGLFAFTRTRPDDLAMLEPWSRAWDVSTSGTFLRTYLGIAGKASLLPPGAPEQRRLLELFVLDKALYELAYELNNRPDWIRIPLAGLLAALGPAAPARQELDDTP